ncbi:uridine phosphorylase [Cyclospora cayetanensis]|uniref:Uridine phosphorylase n=1 Tax=Cyclospora cayetanensis TaxID=88456 RepID=A0A1D3CU72_9EIME|nr:uridine phosphorylase [Cyclospora cayetanensis]
MMLPMTNVSGGHVLGDTLVFLTADIGFRGQRKGAPIIERAKKQEAGLHALLLQLASLGTYKGTPVSIVSIGMGTPNMDFLVREVSFLFQDEGLAFIRLGTCGSFKLDRPVGSLFISDKMYYCYRNYLHFDGNPFAHQGVQQPHCPYIIAGPVEGDKELTEKLEANIAKLELSSVTGSGISAETFYGCQGRFLPGFHDDNDKLFKEFSKLEIQSCEMESHQLFHLCKERAKGNSKVVTRAASICVAVAHRVAPDMPSRPDTLSSEHTREIILKAGEAALDALQSIHV